MSGVSTDAAMVITMLQDKKRRVECFNYSQSCAENVQFLDRTIDCPDGTIACRFQCNLCNEDYWTCGACDNFKQCNSKRNTLRQKDRSHKKR